MQAAIQFFKDALQHEAKAVAFYERAAEITQNDESRMLFLKLIGLEEEHATVLLEKVKGAPCGKAFDVDAYVQTLEGSATDAISPEEAVVMASGSPHQVLEMAIRMEEQAVKNYEGLAQEATDMEVIAHCHEMAAEERKHANELTNLLHSLDMSEEDRPGL